MKNTNKVNNAQINKVKNRYALGLLATLYLLTSSSGINAMMFSPTSLTIPLTRLIKAGSASISAGLQILAYNKLTNAVKSNDLNTVKKLLPYCTKETINKANYCMTPLYWACFRNNLDMVKLLLPYCTKEAINKVEYYDEFTPLYIVYRNNTEPFTFNITNYGLTPLYYACMNDNLDMVQLLLPYCTTETINIADSRGRTLLYCACNNNNLKMVKLLLECGANVDLTALNKAQENSQSQDPTKEAIAIKILSTSNLAQRFDDKFELEQDKSAFIRFIKIDTKGSEFDFILNRAKTKFNYKPNNIFEAHDAVKIAKSVKTDTIIHCSE